MRMIDAYVNTVFKNYFNFKGRMSRGEFWWFFFANFLICFFIGFAVGVSHGFPHGVSHAPTGGPMATTPFMAEILRYELIYSLATLLPNLGAQVRRLHDIGWTGWLVLIDFIPYVGNLIMLILLTFRGKPEGAKYGPHFDSQRSSIGHRQS